MTPTDLAPASAKSLAPTTSTDRCPIPPGWAVRVYRTRKVDGTAVWRGAGIRAEHLCGHGFTLSLGEGPDPGPIEATLPSGEVALFTEVVRLEYDKEKFLEILWSATLHRIREWEVTYCRGEGGCRCQLAN